MLTTQMRRWRRVFGILAPSQCHERWHFNYKHLRHQHCLTRCVKILLNPKLKKKTWKQNLERMAKFQVSKSYSAPPRRKMSAPAAPPVTTTRPRLDRYFDKSCLWVNICTNLSFEGFEGLLYTILSFKGFVGSCLWVKLHTFKEFRGSLYTIPSFKGLIGILTQLPYYIHNLFF